MGEDCNVLYAAERTKDAGGDLYARDLYTVGDAIGKLFLFRNRGGL